MCDWSVCVCEHKRVCVWCRAGCDTLDISYSSQTTSDNLAQCKSIHTAHRKSFFSLTVSCSSYSNNTMHRMLSHALQWVWAIHLHIIWRMCYLVTVQLYTLLQRTILLMRHSHAIRPVQRKYAFIVCTRTHLFRLKWISHEEYFINENDLIKMLFRWYTHFFHTVHARRALSTHGHNSLRGIATSLFWWWLRSRIGWPDNKWWIQGGRPKNVHRQKVFRISAGKTQLHTT